MSNKFKGFLYGALSGITFGTMPLGAMIIYAGGADSISLVFYRNFLPLPFLYYLMQKNKGNNVKLTKTHLFQIIKLVVFGAAATPILLFASYGYISIGTATTIHFIYPAFVMVGLFVFYGEKISKVKLTCVVLCTIGVLFFYTPGETSELIGILLSFASGITFAFYAVYLDKSGLKNIPPLQLAFYISLTSSIFVFIYTRFTGGLTYDFSPFTWTVCIIFALCLAFGGLIAFQTSVKLIGAQLTALINTFEPVTSIIWGVLVFKDVLTLKISIGIIVIIVSVCILAICENDKGKAIPSSDSE